MTPNVAIYIQEKPEKALKKKVIKHGLLATTVSWVGSACRGTALLRDLLCSRVPEQSAHSVKMPATSAHF